MTKADTVTETNTVTDTGARTSRTEATTPGASISPLLAHFRRAVRGQREARRARVELRRELAQYNTPADRLELEAIMDRHTPEETEELRAIFGRLAL